MATSKLRVIVETQDRELDKLQGKLKKTQKGVDGIGAANNRVKSSFLGLGAGAKSAAVGVRGLGVAFNAALGPIGAAVAAIGSLTAAFNVLSTQDFAEAKFRSLGGDSKVLSAELKALSAELKGQASVVELTGAAYDVASAGFSKAADAAKVLKAASLGATGGFSDINTVGNATTSVLNAYGLAASEAEGLVDKFIQTQNDGKIVVAQYAQNIGKVASAAAGLKIPLSEVNAVIAQATASGVQAEVAFTGLKGAFARLASGEASKALSKFGISIDSASLEADGLLGTLKKLEGLDTGTLFKALGTEAGPALLPVINNLERFEELIRNQENSAGAAAAAQAEAANTIQGAWKSVVTEFQNFFADQSEAGQIIKLALQGTALALKALAAGFNTLVAPVRALFTLFGQLGQAIDGAFDVTGKVQSVLDVFERLKGVIEPIKDIYVDTFGTIKSLLEGFGDEILVAFTGPIEGIKDAWSSFVDTLQGLWDDFTGFFSDSWDAVTDAASSAVDFISGAWSNFISTASEQAGGFGTFVQSVWNGIANGAGQVVGAISGAFSRAFQAAKNIITSFWNSLPEWLKGALSAAGSVVGGVTSAVTGALSKVAGEIKGAFSGGSAEVKEALGGEALDIAVPQPVVDTGGGGGGGGAGGGGGGGGGASKAAQEAERAAKQTERQLKAAEKLVFKTENRLRLEKEMNEVQQISEKGAVKRLEIERQFSELLENSKSAAETALLQVAQTNELKALELETESQLAELRSGALESITQENELLTARLAGKEEEYLIQKKINDLVASGGGSVTASEAAGLVQTNEKLKEQAKAVESLEGQYKSLASGIASDLGGALKGLISGTKTAEEAFSEFFQSIADRFLDMALQILQDQITQQLVGLFSSLGGGLGGGGGFGALGSFGGGSSNLFGNSLGSFGGGSFGGFFANGGTLGAGNWGIAGEAGPELISGPATVTPASEMGGGSTVVNITINSDGNGKRSASGSDPEDAARLGRLIERSTLAVINREKRPGGALRS